MIDNASIPSESSEKKDYTTGTPWLDCDLEGNVTPETNVSLKDHFALAVCKDKILSLEIPQGYSSGGTTMDIVLQNVKDIKQMFLGDAPKERSALLAYNLFWLMKDWDSRNAQGVSPLKKLIDKIEAIDTVQALAAYLLETPEEEQFARLWEGGSTEDLVDSTKRVLGFVAADLLLEDSAEYLEPTELGKIKKGAMERCLKTILLKLGYTEEESLKKIDNCFAFEKLLAPTIPTAEEQNSPEYFSNANNFFSYDDVKKMAGILPVLERLEAEGFPKADTYLVIMPKFLPRLSELFTQENLPMIKDCLIMRNAFSAVRYLDRECFDARIRYGNEVYGATGTLPDEDYFTSLVSTLLKWPVGRLYAETYLRESDKIRISNMIDKIIKTYHGIINDAEFLSDTTKANAIEKLDSMKKFVLYPDSWEKYDCPNLRFPSKEEGGTLWQAITAIRADKHARDVKEHFEPVDKDKWPEPPSKVNCQYNVATNSVYIYGAFTQGEMYSSEMSDEEMLGRIGWVCGHEISHAFDANGGQFDKYGNMNKWWTDEDYAAFLKRNEKMAAYYNNMHPWEGQNFRGNIMTGEGTADMGGLKAILRIAKEMENFDYDALFRSLSYVWLSKGTIGEALEHINDPHPMGYLRVNCTLQQFDEFLNFYGIKEGDGMYLAPEDRVAIW